MNGVPRTVEDDVSVAEVVGGLEGVGDAGRGVAVALNGEVVARSRWAEQRLNEGDRLEILRAVGGGA